MAGNISPALGNPVVFRSDRTVPPDWVYRAAGESGRSPPPRPARPWPPCRMRAARTHPDARPPFPC